MKILLAILNSDPPSISDSNFSKEFKDFVDMCLQKNPSKRPTTEKLLKHKFLSKACDSEYLASELLSKVSDLKDRIPESLRIQGEGNQKFYL